MRTRLINLPIVLLIMLIACISGSSQTATATLKGVVTDSSEKVLPGAALTLTQNSTGLKRTFTADDGGQFTFTFLEPGNYSLEVQATGFKKYKLPDINLQVTQSAELRVVLQAGDIAESITVSSEQTTLQLDTASSSLSGIVQRKQIDDLPLNGRNVFQLAQLEAGVNTSPGSRSSLPSLAAGGVGEMSINGGRTLTNEIVVDGIPITNKADNLPSLRPSPEAVSEFRIVTNSYSAELGRTGGGALNFSIRSGGNKIRATLFDFLRNDALDATNFFVNNTGQKKGEASFQSIRRKPWRTRLFAAVRSGRRSDKESRRAVFLLQLRGPEDIPIKSQTIDCPDALDAEW